MFNFKQSVTVKESFKDIPINSNVNIYTHIIQSGVEGKTAIFIHGGGSGGNHTMLVRPAKWMINKGLFSTVILPDKRGEGKSSKIDKQMTIKDHAKDMKNLLDNLEIKGKITAMGISYGGPTALTLAGICDRVSDVVLFASSPSLKSAKGITGFLNKHNLLEPIVKAFYTKTIGTSSPQYTNLDCIYDINNKKQLNKIFLNAIKSTEKDRLESLLIQNAATLNQNNSSIDKDINLDIPIYQVIGDKDEIWETNLTEYSERFPNIKSTKVDKADHKDSLLNAGQFYEQFFKIYKDA